MYKNKVLANISSIIKEKKNKNNSNVTTSSSHKLTSSNDLICQPISWHVIANLLDDS